MLVFTRQFTAVLQWLDVALRRRVGTSHLPSSLAGCLLDEATGLLLVSHVWVPQVACVVFILASFETGLFKAGSLDAAYLLIHEVVGKLVPWLEPNLIINWLSSLLRFPSLSMATATFVSSQLRYVALLQVLVLDILHLHTRHVLHHQLGVPRWA